MRAIKKASEEAFRCGAYHYHCKLKPTLPPASLPPKSLPRPKYTAEASVILAAEPLAAAALGSIMLHEELATYDYIGGALIITACLVNTLKPEDIIARTNALFASSSAPDAAREAKKSGR